METPKPTYHYTKGLHWPSIAASGVLRLTDIGLAPGEPPSLWASTDALFVGCVAAVHASSRATGLDWTARNTAGAYRIQIHPSVPALDWRAFAAAYLPGAFEKRLRKAAQECGDNVRDWRVYLEPVPRASWVAVERYDLDTQRWAQL